MTKSSGRWLLSGDSQCEPQRSQRGFRMRSQPAISRLRIVLAFSTNLTHMRKFYAIRGEGHSRGEMSAAGTELS
jgi:hypothetical protein